MINAIGCRSLPPQGVDFFQSISYTTEGFYRHIGRVEAARPGALTEALGRSVTAASEAGGGHELTTSWLAHGEADSAGIMVRHAGPGGVGQSHDGDGLDPCTLEIRLPPGHALTRPPRVWLGSDKLRVELVLSDGPGGRDAFALSECPPTTTPIDVVLGGD